MVNKEKYRTGLFGGDENCDHNWKDGWWGEGFDCGLTESGWFYEERQHPLYCTKCRGECFDCDYTVFIPDEWYLRIKGWFRKRRSRTYHWLRRKYLKVWRRVYLLRNPQ